MQSLPTQITLTFTHHNKTLCFVFPFSPLLHISAHEIKSFRERERERICSYTVHAQAEHSPTGPALSNRCYNLLKVYVIKSFCRLDQNRSWVQLVVHSAADMCVLHSTCVHIIIQRNVEISHCPEADWLDRNRTSACGYCNSGNKIKTTRIKRLVQILRWVQGHELELPNENLLSIKSKESHDWTNPTAIFYEHC